MSVINHMLLSLEHRQHHAPQAQLPDPVRAVHPGPTASRSNQRWPLLALIVALLIIAALYGLQLQSKPDTVASVAQVEETFRIAPPAAITPTAAPITQSNEPAPAAAKAVDSSPPLQEKNAKKQIPTVAASPSKYLLPARNEP